MLLDLPETARIIKRQKCAVQAFQAGDYTMRSSYSPLAEVSVQCEALYPLEINPLITQLEVTRGVDYLELPYLSNGERYLVQEYKLVPLLYQQLTTLELTMVQQRSALVPEDSTVVRIPYVPIYESFNTANFRNYSQQYDGGYQGTKPVGTWRSAERIWDVTFHLSAIECALLDAQLVARRGIYPFLWNPTNDLLSLDAWLCAEWQIEYFATDLYIFMGKLLYWGLLPLIDSGQVTIDIGVANSGLVTIGVLP
jgi:phage-related protein